MCIYFLTLPFKLIAHFFNKNYNFVCSCTHVRTCAIASCGDYRSTCQSGFLSSKMQGPGIKLRLLGLVTNTFTCAVFIWIFNVLFYFVYSVVVKPILPRLSFLISPRIWEAKRVMRMQREPSLITLSLSPSLSIRRRCSYLHTYKERDYYSSELLQ